MKKRKILSVCYHLLIWKVIISESQIKIIIMAILDVVCSKFIRFVITKLVHFQKHSVNWCH